MKWRLMAIGLGAAMAGALLWTGSAPIVAASDPTATARAQQVNGQAAVKTALMYLGTHYVAGGTQPDTGFDDVGFVQWVYAQQGVNLPSDLSDMRTMAHQLRATGLHPGHLIFFKNTIRAGLSHVGIYVGKGRFIHAEWYGYGVALTWLKNDPKDGSYWSSHLVGALNLRTIPSGPGYPVLAVGTTVVVAVNAANLHSRPTFVSSSVGVVQQGTQLTVTAARAEWVQVAAADGRSGWIWFQFISGLRHSTVERRRS